MLVPYPSNLIRGVVLILRQPELPFFADHVEYLDIIKSAEFRFNCPDRVSYLSSDISQVWIASLFPRAVDVKLIHTGSQE